MLVRRHAVHQAWSAKIYCYWSSFSDMGRRANIQQPLMQALFFAGHGANGRSFEIAPSRPPCNLPRHVSVNYRAPRSRLGRPWPLCFFRGRSSDYGGSCHHFHTGRHRLRLSCFLRSPGRPTLRSGLLAGKTVLAGFRFICRSEIFLGRHAVRSLPPPCFRQRKPRKQREMVPVLWARTNSSETGWHGAGVVFAGVRRAMMERALFLFWPQRCCSTAAFPAATFFCRRPLYGLCGLVALHSGAAASDPRVRPITEHRSFSIIAGPLNGFGSGGRTKMGRARSCARRLSRPGAPRRDECRGAVSFCG